MRCLPAIVFCALMSAALIPPLMDADRGEKAGAARKLALAQDDLRQMEAQIGACYAKGGVARLGRVFLGCDLPVPE